MSNIQNNKNQLIWIIVLLVIIAGLVWWNLSQRHDLNEIVEQMTIEKEELQEEYEDLAIQFDGYQQMDIPTTCAGLARRAASHQSFQRTPYSRTQERARYRSCGHERLCASDRQPQRHQRTSDGREHTSPSGEPAVQGAELSTLNAQLSTD